MVATAIAMLVAVIWAIGEVLSSSFWNATGGHASVKLPSPEIHDGDAAHGAGDYVTVAALDVQWRDKLS